MFIYIFLSESTKYFSNNVSHHEKAQIASDEREKKIQFQAGVKKKWEKMFGSVNKFFIISDDASQLMAANIEKLKNTQIGCYTKLNQENEIKFHEIIFSLIFIYFTTFSSSMKLNFHKSNLHHFSSN
jgi:hypothetical protein